MSIRGLSLPCPKCGDDGAFFLVKDEDNHYTFAKGYCCGVCGHYWDARFQDKLDHPDEYIPYDVREAAGGKSGVDWYHWPDAERLRWSREWLTKQEEAKNRASS